MKSYLNKLKILIILTMMIVIYLLYTSPCLSADKNYITVILSRDIKQYNEALKGFKQKISMEGYRAEYSYFNLLEFKNSELDLIRKIKSDQPNLIFAIGTEAALFAKANFIDEPIVFSMVLDPVEKRIVNSLRASGTNITGVVLKIDAETQFRKLKQVLPDVDTIGMLYDAKERKNVKDEAEKAAKRLGMNLVAKPVSSNREIDGKLKELLRESDIIWQIVDPLIYNLQSAEPILLAILRNKKPFMAYSIKWVKAGALFTLETNYDDIGSQSGDLAIEILNGKNPGSLPIEKPKELRLIVNSNTEKVIGIKIPRNYVDKYL